MTSFHKKLTILLVFILVCSGSTTGLMGKESKIKGDRLNFFNKLLQTVDIGEKLNITLHQSYVNPTTIEFANLSDSNEFALPCPTESSFNSSYNDILIDNIYAPNKSLELELDTLLTQTLMDSIDNKFAFSFRVVNSCFLESFSFCFTEDNPDNIEGEIQVDLLAAEINESNIIPSSLIKILNLTYFIDDDISETWFNFTGYHEYLNTTNTVNNTFFITLRQKSDPVQTRIRFHYMHDLLGDLIDSSLVYESDGGDWILRDFDASLIVNVSPVYNTPKPSQVDLKINNTKVSDNLDNSGFWTSTEEYSNPSGQLEFELSTDWWDVACDITKAQINYTKTDLKASTEYEIPEPDLVIWNASINEPIDSFDSRIDDYNYISFLVPENWSDIKAFNGIVEKPVDVSAPIVNGFQEVNVLQAENGANWYLTASVDNRSPGNGKGTIPFGNIFLLFTSISIICLIYFKKRKFKK